MDKRAPAVSVLMPVYNGGRFLSAAVESVLAQTFTDFELIAIDDGSTDDSVDRLRAIAVRDDRVVVVAQGRLGLVESLNRGLAIARAPLVARMDADDISYPDRFARQVAFLDHRPEVAVVSGAMDMIDEEGVYLNTAVFPTASADIKRELHHRCCMCHPAVMARTAILRSIGGYRASLQYAEDYDLWLRIAEVAELANLPDVLLSYRMHPFKTSTRHLIVQELAALAARGAARFRQRGLPDPLDQKRSGFAGNYRASQRMFAQVIPRVEFAVTFFRAVIGRSVETGSVGAWAHLYVRYGLWDLDRDRAAMILLVLAHTILRCHRSGASFRVGLPYLFWAIATAVCHPFAAWSVVCQLRKWGGLARARTEADVHQP